MKQKRTEDKIEKSRDKEKTIPEDNVSGGNLLGEAFVDYRGRGNEYPENSTIYGVDTDYVCAIIGSPREVTARRNFIR